MFQKLWVRFALIIAIALLSWGILQVYPLKRGIDLAGGIDMTYELDLSKIPGDKTDIAKQVIATLKERIDPNGVKNLTWRAVAGGTRIEIQMPQAGKDTIAARERFEEAKKALANQNLRMSEVSAALTRTGEVRKAALDKLAAVGTPRRTLLEQLAAAYDSREKLLAAEDKDSKLLDSAPHQQALADAKQAYDKAWGELTSTNLDMNWLTETLEASDNPKNAAARESLAKLPAQYPQCVEAIKTLREAYENLRLHRGSGFDDPADLQRMLKGSGVLDFRIAVQPTKDNESAVKQALEQLHNLGPAKAKAPSMRWFEVDPKNAADLGRGDSVIVEAWKGGKYALLHTDPDHALYHGPPWETWKLAKAQVGSDPQTGQTMVEFWFDPLGGTYFGRMTGFNVGKPMAILLDDRVLSAPNIRSAITGGQGQITFGTVTETHTVEQIVKEANMLVRMLRAGSLPATLQPEPVSVQQIGSELGKDNIEAGLQSGIYAVIAVMAFMMVYYTLTGSFANLAVMLNLMITLAAMAMLGATFTLPGIAGIVLTLGMAVDANVLINERIREEVHRGASLWLAVRQGYDKVFWTIFDANTTTSLTSIVLIAVASEEVKGFGVTLLIGLMVHMFTALFVTRTLMMAGIKWGIMRQIDDHSIAEYLKEVFTLTWLRKGRWPFMRVITVTNFDWIGKRHYFWVVSALITLAGIAAFFMRGDDKYDTEFNGGSQITFRVNQPTDIEVIRKRISGDIRQDLEHDAGKLRAAAKGQQGDARQLSENHAAVLGSMARELEQARVVAVGKEGTKFQLVTTIAEKQQSLELQDRLINKLADLLSVQRKISYRGAELPDATTLEQLQNSKLVYPISSSDLEKSVPGFSAADAAQNDVSNYVGGVALVLEEIAPPQTVGDMAARISNLRSKPDFATAQFRDVKVIPVAYAPGENPTGGADAKVAKAVLIVSDPTISWSPEADGSSATEDTNWTEKVAHTEWRLAQQALTSQSSLEGVTRFDAQVAGDAKRGAIVALVLSLLLILVYVWFRFGGLRYGAGAILSLGHDAIVALAATVLSGVFLREFPTIAHALLISDFKINLTMIAAYLTIVGYSVNDTIVIFDRIRENRGRSMTPLTAKLVNDSINQCFGRTIWTTFTVFIVVLIMYIWGGEGVRGFSFAMLIGVFTGAYSTLAIAAPALLNVKDMPKKATVKLAKIEDGLWDSGLAPKA